MVTPPNVTYWVLSQGMAGTEKQCIGVADALGDLVRAWNPDAVIDYSIKRIGLNFPWSVISPPILWGGRWAFDMHDVQDGNDANGQDWAEGGSGALPDIIIASGRQAILPALYLKKHIRRHADKPCFVTYLQSPKLVKPQCFDLVSVPAHDQMRGANILVSHGAPNTIRTQDLDKAKQDWAPVFEKITGPRLAVLIGGTSRAYDMDDQAMAAIIAGLKNLAANGLGVMVTCSRRSGAGRWQRLYDNLAGQDNIYIWDGQGANPYLGMLAWADGCLVSQDSVSMISECGTAGRPVWTIPLKGGSSKMGRFHQYWQDLGVVQSCLHQFGMQGDTAHLRVKEALAQNQLLKPPVINDSKMIASAIFEQSGFFT